MKSYGEAGFRRYVTKAAPFIDNKRRAAWLLKRVLSKSARSKIMLISGLKNIKWLILLFKDWLSGKYRQLSRASLLTLTAGLLYFVAPVDLIIDYIPFGGFIDDAAVIGFVLNRINNDIEKYKLWRKVEKTTDPGMDN